MQGTKAAAYFRFTILNTIGNSGPSPIDAFCDAPYHFKTGISRKNQEPGPFDTSALLFRWRSSICMSLVKKKGR